MLGSRFGKTCWLVAAMAVSPAALDLRVARCADFPPPAQLPSQPSLPDPLAAFDGSKIADAEQWNAKRRPELKSLFEHYMYGRYPRRPEHVTGKVLFETPDAFGGAGTLREVEITFGPFDWPKIYLLIASQKAKRPVACFVGANFAGNPTGDELSRERRASLSAGYRSA